MDKIRGKAGRYILYFASFLLAGALQWLGKLTKGTLSLLFYVFSCAIFFALVLFWAFSAQRRMPSKRDRYLLLGIASLLLLFLIIRFARYFLFNAESSIARYLWYAYYLPELFVPVLVATMVVPLKGRRPFGIALSLVSLLFAIVIFTNDLHQWVFILDADDPSGESYAHNWFFYVFMVYIVAVLLLSVLFLIYRCKKQGGKKKFFFLPVAVLFSCVLIDALFFFFDLPMYQIPELMCFSFLALFESCIAISLFPSNDDYKEYFSLSSTQALIIDEGGSLIAKSKGAMLPSLQEREDALRGEIYINGGTRLRSARIAGGWVLIEEDLSSLRALEKRLLENKEELMGEQDLLVYENEVKGKEAAIKEKKEIFKTINQLGRTLLPDISLCLDKARAGDYARNISAALLRLAYLKRKANLLLKEEKSLPFEDLYLSINESLRYLPCSSSSRLRAEGEFPKKGILKIYEDFELVAESLPEGIFFLLDLKRAGNKARLRFFFSSEVALPSPLKGKRREEKGEEGHLLELVYAEGKA